MTGVGQPYRRQVSTLVHFEYLIPKSLIPQCVQFDPQSLMCSLSDDEISDDKISDGCPAA